MNKKSILLLLLFLVGIEPISSKKIPLSPKNKWHHEVMRSPSLSRVSADYEEGVEKECRFRFYICPSEEGDWQVFE